VVLGFIRRAFSRLTKGLQKTRALFATILGRGLDEATLDALEEALISADCGLDLSMRLVDEVREAFKEGRLKDTKDAFLFLRSRLLQILGEPAPLLRAPSPPTLYLFAGVNGTGKTTSIAKLAYQFAKEGEGVVIAACDTFRAAAIEQLERWTERIRKAVPKEVVVHLVRHQMGGDPAAVAFDSIDAALAREAQHIIVDTAGRLHTKTPLMEELRKIVRVVSQKLPGAPHESLLVMDATVGQNGIAQARKFKEAIDLTGIFLAKLDGTAKGGVVLAIKDQLGIPVKLVGVGESFEDIAAFNPQQFVDALLGTGEEMG